MHDVCLGRTKLREENVQSTKSTEKIVWKYIIPRGVCREELNKGKQSNKNTWILMMGRTKSFFLSFYFRYKKEEPEIDKDEERADKVYSGMIMIKVTKKYKRQIVGKNNNKIKRKVKK